MRLGSPRVGFSSRLDPDGQIPQEILLSNAAGPEVAAGPQMIAYRLDGLAQLLALTVDLGLTEEFSVTAATLATTLRRERADTGYFFHRGSVDTPHWDRRFFKYGYYENGEEAKTLSYWTNMFSVHGRSEVLSPPGSDAGEPRDPCGRRGVRCWPLSTRTQPKALNRPFLAIVRYCRRRCIDSATARQPANLP